MQFYISRGGSVCVVKYHTFAVSVCVCICAYRERLREKSVCEKDQVSRPHISIYAYMYVCVYSETIVCVFAQHALALTPPVLYMPIYIYSDREPCVHLSASLYICIYAYIHQDRSVSLYVYKYVCISPYICAYI